jgi:hypothetical protein
MSLLLSCPLLQSLSLYCPCLYYCPAPCCSPCPCIVPVSITVLPPCYSPCPSTVPVFITVLSPCYRPCLPKCPCLYDCPAPRLQSLAPVLSLSILLFCPPVTVPAHCIVPVSITVLPHCYSPCPLYCPCLYYCPAPLLQFLPSKVSLPPVEPTVSPCLAGFCSIALARVAWGACGVIRAVSCTTTPPSPHPIPLSHPSPPPLLLPP